MSTVTINVDGRNLEATPGEMLICVTDRNGIYIPRFCYHEKLSVAANCRMCLVEVERAPKPLPACATPVMDGMKVQTRSITAQEAQKGTMEFLLINHPLDCPVCDQGGECPLQDQALGYGRSDSRFQEQKRSVASHDIGPLVATEMTRCIHCTRCVRFGEEVAGLLEMGAPGRGEHMKISTFLNRPVNSEVSGNMIDLCPVGALTSRPFRFAARSWELTSNFGISPHDCLGTNINIQTLRNCVERVLPIENAEINECWIADRDRFSYEAINCRHRLTVPMIKRAGAWEEATWETALTHAANGLKRLMDNGSAAEIGGLATWSSTLEEFHLLQKLVRAMGSDSVDYRLRQCDFRDDDIAPPLPVSEVPIRAFSDRESVLLVGSNIRKEQPLLALRLRNGWQTGKTRIAAINPIDHDLNFGTSHLLIAPGNSLVSQLAALASAVAGARSMPLPPEIRRIADKHRLTDLADQICQAGGNGLVVLGEAAQQHPNASLIKAIVHWLAEAAGSRIALLAPGNSAAGALANCQPGEGGRNTGQMLAGGMRGFILLGCEPELDCMDGKQALSAMQDSDFVIQLSAFRSESVMQYADVLLPMATFAESSGSYLNCEGRLQRSRAAVTPPGEVKPAWKILRVLGNFLGCRGFDYMDLEDIETELSPRTENPAPTFRLGKWRLEDMIEPGHTGLTRLSGMPMYRGEATLRHARALQSTADTPAPVIRVHPDTLSELGLKSGEQALLDDGDTTAQLPVKEDPRIPEKCIYLPSGFAESAMLGIHNRVSLEPLDGRQG